MERDQSTFTERGARVRVLVGAARLSPGYDQSPLKPTLELCWRDLNDPDLCKEDEVGETLLKLAERALAAFEVVA